MTPQLLIVKIQALLGGRLEVSPVQKRALAMEYYKMCSDAESQLEHCIALIKAGREYPALQFAESSSILDKVNALSFMELPQWRDFCSTESLPLPPPFSEEQISQISVLYSKGITQTHPLYRDYRRAMRMRDYGAALAVIRTISKINTYDAEARSEYDRLRKLLSDKKLKALRAALDGSDKGKIISICEDLAPDAEFLSGNPVWEEALERKRGFDEEVARSRAREILSAISKLDASKDISKISELVSEYNLLGADLATTEKEAELLDDCNKKVSEYQDLQVNLERSARARNMVSIELETPTPMPPSERLKFLKKLRSEAGETLDATSAKKLNSAISALSSKILAKRILTVGGGMAAAAIAVWVGCGIYYESEYKARLARAGGELLEISQLQDPRIVSERLDAFAGKYPDFVETSDFAGEIAKLRETANLDIGNIERISKLLKSVEAMDFAKASAMELENAQADLEKVLSEVPNLSAAVRDSVADKSDSLSRKLSSAIDSRRKLRSKTLSEALGKYDALLEKYENFSESREALDAQEARLSQIIMPIVEDVTQMFKPSQSDVERYADVAQRIKAARATYLKADELYKSLMDSRTATAYFNQAHSMETSGVMSADFSKKLSRILACEKAVKSGQLSDFADSDAAEKSVDYPMLGSGKLPSNGLMTNVYRNINAQKTNTYTLGEINVSSQSWPGGSETIQKCKVIYPSGAVRDETFRMNYVDGKQPRGELLSTGTLSIESKTGREAEQLALSKSWLAALEFIADAKINPIYKLLFEAKIFEQMLKNPVESSLAFSPSAKERCSVVKKMARGFNDYSWMFEPQSKVNFVESELYSKPSPKYELEAMITKKAIEIARSNPIQMIGVADSKGNPVLFKQPSGAIRSVADDGSFSRAETVDKIKIAPLAPIFSEKISSDEIVRKSKESVK